MVERASAGQAGRGAGGLTRTITLTLTLTLPLTLSLSLSLSLTLTLTLTLTAAQEEVLARLRRYLGSVGGSGALVDGWKAEIKYSRARGSHGMHATTFVAPSGRRLTSHAEVARYLGLDPAAAAMPLLLPAPAGEGAAQRGAGCGGRGGGQGGGRGGGGQGGLGAPKPGTMVVSGGGASRGGRAAGSAPPAPPLVRMPSQLLLTAKPSAAGATAEPPRRAAGAKRRGAGGDAGGGGGGGGGGGRRGSWGAAESTRLEQARLETSPLSLNFWGEVAAKMPGRTAAECSRRHHSKAQSSPAAKKRRLSAGGSTGGGRSRSGGRGRGRGRDGGGGGGARGDAWASVPPQPQPPPAALTASPVRGGGARAGGGGAPLVLSASELAGLRDASPEAAIQFASPWRFEEVEDEGDEGGGDEGGEGGGGILQPVGAARRASIGKYAGGTKAKRLLGRGEDAARRRRERAAKVPRVAAPGACVITADLLREACEGRPPVDDASESESDDDHYFD